MPGRLAGICLIIFVVARQICAAPISPAPEGPLHRPSHEERVEPEESHPAGDIGHAETMVIIDLLSGERLIGELEHEDDQTIVLLHATFGRLTVPADQVASIEPLPVAESGDGPPTQEAAETAGEARVQVPDQDNVDVVPLDQQSVDDDVDVPEPKVKPSWDFGIELGLTARRGNTDDESGRAAFRGERIVPSNTLRFDASYRFARSQGERTESRFSTGAFSEWPKNDTPWSVFAQGRFEMDKFESWDERITGSGGMSYQLIDYEVVDDASGAIHRGFDLTLRGGSGFRKEFGSEEEEFAPEGLLGAELQWIINSRMRLNAGSTWFPNLRQFSDYRVVSNVDWIVDINSLDGISLKFGIAHEFESETDAGVDQSDLSTFATLVIDF